MIKSLYSLEALVNGRPVKEHPTNQKVFIQGNPGSEYTIRLRNNSWKRIMAVVSVDGVDTISGRAAAESNDGYILDAYSSTEIKGYRIDENTVAAFKFGDTQRSYANEVGAKTTNTVTKQEEHKKTTANNGVIGVRIFEEKTKDIDYLSHYNQPNNGMSGTSGNSGTVGSTGTSGAGGILRSARMLYTSNTLNVGSSQATGHHIHTFGLEGFCVTSCMQPSEYVMSAQDLQGSPSFDLGTTWGTKTTDKVRRVSFERSDSFIDLELYYATRQSLEEWGIDFSNTKHIFTWPKAFEDRKQFCTPPSWYKG